jgi:hypothetical protein
MNVGRMASAVMILEAGVATHAPGRLRRPAVDRMPGSELRRRGLAWPGDGVKAPETRQMRAPKRWVMRDEAKRRLLGTLPRSRYPVLARWRSRRTYPVSCQDYVELADHFDRSFVR